MTQLIRLTKVKLSRYCSIGGCHCIAAADCVRVPFVHVLALGSAVGRRHFARGWEQQAAYTESRLGCFCSQRLPL